MMVTMTINKHNVPGGGEMNLKHMFGARSQEACLGLFE